MEPRCSEFAPIYYFLVGFFSKLEVIKSLSFLIYWPLFSLNPLKTLVGARCEYFFA